MREAWIDPPAQPIVKIFEPLLPGVPERVEFGQFSRKQRAWLMRRDTDEATGLVRCQFFGQTSDGHWTQCPNDEQRLRGTSKLHAHHITAQGFWERWFNGRMGDEGESPHQPWNAILLCQLHHVNHPKSIHPDYHEARVNYGRNPDGFKQVGQKHSELADAGEFYWNTSHDQILYEIARDRTEEYLASHPFDPWPEG